MTGRDQDKETICKETIEIRLANKEAGKVDCRQTSSAAPRESGRENPVAPASRNWSARVAALSALPQCVPVGPPQSRPGGAPDPHVTNSKGQTSSC